MVLRIVQYYFRDNISKVISGNLPAAAPAGNMARGPAGEILVEASYPREGVVETGNRGIRT